MRDWVEADFPIFGVWERPGAAAGAVAFLHDPLGRVLMQLRDDWPGLAQAGRWGPFGGGVEPGEGLTEAVLREVAEETGLRLDPATLRPLGRVLSNTRARTRLHAFAAPLPAPAAAIRLGEGAGFALLTPRQIRSYPLAWPLRPLALRAAAAAG